MSISFLTILGFGIGLGGVDAASPEVSLRRLDTQADTTAQQPFRRFRDRPLDYHGPENREIAGPVAEEIRIAWFGPSDPDDTRQGDLWWSAELAVTEANRRGDFEGTPVRLIPAWSENPWGTGVARLFRVVYEAPVVAVLGSIDGASTHLAEQIVAKACLPLVSPLASDDSVNLAGVPWMFSCAPSDQAIAQVLTDSILLDREGKSRAHCDPEPLGGTSSASPRVRGLIAASQSSALRCTRFMESDLPPERMLGDDELKVGRGVSGEPPKQARETVRPTEVKGRFMGKTGRPAGGVVLLSATDHDSRAAATTLQRELEQQGLPVKLKLEFPAAATDLGNQVEAIRRAKAGAILLVAGPETSARVVNAIRTGSIGVPIHATQHLGRWRRTPLERGADVNLRYVDLVSSHSDRETRTSFEGKYRAKFLRNPDFAAMLTYDATCVLLEAIQRAGPHRAAIRDALVELSPWLGVCGPIRWDGTGRNTRRPDRLISPTDRNPQIGGR